MTGFLDGRSDHKERKACMRLTRVWAFVRLVINGRE
jgi:hypothetical protein